MSLFLIVVFPILYVLIVVNYYQDPKRVLWVKNALIKKNEFVQNINSNKLIFTGGSATLFGVRTKDIQNSLGIPTVNMAIHAGLRLDYIIFQAKKVLKPGDSVIIPLEYQLLLYDGESEHNLTRSAYMFTHDHRFFNSLNGVQQLKEGLSVLPKDIYDAYILNRNFDNKEVKIGMGYNSSTINKNGDESYHPNSDLIREKIGKGIIKPFKVPGYGFRETRSLKEIRKFNRWCKLNKINFFMTYPNVLAFDVFKAPQYKRYFRDLENYYHEYGIQTIGKPLDYFYSVDYFYDTPYHLNKKGMTIRTEQLLQQLKKIDIL